MPTPRLLLSLLALTTPPLARAAAEEDSLLIDRS